MGAHVQLHRDRMLGFLVCLSHGSGGSKAPDTAQASLSTLLMLLLGWMLLAGCRVVMGTSIMQEFLAKSFSVTCIYQPGQETKHKFWCKLGKIYICAADIVTTSELQPVVWPDRFSIWDNCAHRALTVIVEGPAMGIYCCGGSMAKAARGKSNAGKVIVSCTCLPRPPSNSDHHAGGQEEMAPGRGGWQGKGASQCRAGTHCSVPLSHWQPLSLRPAPTLRPKTPGHPRGSSIPLGYSPALARLQLQGWGPCAEPCLG
ncbi:uncharacterized protein LOC121086765 [Falco naumanni]|uniref:uncharacterized protein LOC121086765 n=1 Tax=Falco naumanni TaxID=148594 RepID=UPI001ADE7667|nr:uncharacterized protein LOC121086765 [Falco naumanni]